MSEVAVRFPARTWAMLAQAADKRGVKIPDLIAAAAAEFVRPTRHEWVVLLARAGLPDREIAARTGETVAFVARVRLKAGIRRREAK